MLFVDDIILIDETFHENTPKLILGWRYEDKIYNPMGSGWASLTKYLTCQFSDVMHEADWKWGLT